MDRQGFCPLPQHGHRAALQGPPSIHSCPAQGSPEGVGGGGFRRGSLGLTRWPALHHVVSVSWSLWHSAELTGLETAATPSLPALDAGLGRAQEGLP